MSSTVETILGRVRRAQLFYENIQDLYLGIGRTSEWSDEEDPPKPTGEEEDIEEAIAFKKVNQMFYVVEDEINGTISFRGKLWRILDGTEIFDEKCRWIYVSSGFVGDEAPLVEYRQIGLFSELIPHEGYEDKDLLLPAEVEDRGALEIIGYREKTQRQEDQTDKPVIILEF